jgi:hypothetical protein
MGRVPVEHHGGPVPGGLTHFAAAILSSGGFVARAEPFFLRSSSNF